MARKRRYKRKKTEEKTKKNILVITLIILSILLGVLIYTESGIIGIKLSEILGGMMGIIKYFLPIGIFALGIKIATDDDRYISTKLLQFLVLLLSICVLMSIYQMGTEIRINDKEVSEILKDAYSLGIKENGGGAMGALLAIPLVKLLGKVGAMILVIGVVTILVVSTFGINISEIINETVKKSEEKNEKRKEQKLIDRELKLKEKLKYEKELEKINGKNKQATEEIENKEKNEKMQEQIKINLGGRLIDEENLNNGEIKEEKTEEKRDENSLFRQEEEKKEDKTKEVLQLQHAMMIEEDENYVFPPINLLNKPDKKALKGGTKSLTDTAEKLRKTLYSFGVSAKVDNVSVGPAITRYEIKPAEGVRVSKIANLADDIALNLAAKTIRIEAPIPGKQAVGIEVPNKEKVNVTLREVLESDEFQSNNSKLTFALGKDVAGNVKLADIAKMPHMLIAGATGSGKSVCINTIITSILYNAKPSEVKLVMIDPKVVELSVYNEIPHLLIPVVTDPKKAAGALAWAVQEMDNRYNLFAGKGVRDLKGYNKEIEKENGIGKLPQIVIIVDELADLMMVASKEVEEAICRLAQKARAAGMHLVIATQRPSVDVITGLIKANIPSRIAFAVSSQVDSRTILDMSGAEKLLGKGDMLFYPSGEPKPIRVQGAFVSDEEVEKLVEFVKKNGRANYNDDILKTIENNDKTDKEISEETDDDTDPFLMDAIDAVVEAGTASTSFIQRKFKVGYARAGRIIDQMEERGIISGYQGSKPREVLMTKERLQELKMGTTENNNSNNNEDVK